jgi:hypothetical protein
MEKTARKIQIGFALAGWSIFGIIAYKFWGKSKLWNYSILGFGALNALNTFKTFSKPAITTTKVDAQTTTEATKTTASSATSAKSSGNSLTAEQAFNEMSKLSSQKGDKDGFVKSYNKLNEKEKAAFKDQMEEMKKWGSDISKIPFEKMMENMANLQNKLVAKHGQAIIDSLQQKMNG